MRVLMWPTAAALLIAVGLLSVPAANAQVQSPSPGLSDQSPNISDQKLNAAPDYADAMFNLALLLQRGSRHKEAASAGGNILPMMLNLNGQHAPVDP
jgi:hypothetical protein